jgi:probable F420-dependent oxidoreductase
MKLSLIFPSTEIGNDPVAIRDWAQGVEGLGYDQIQLFEHVIGGNPASYPDLGAYTSQTPFHEPFVLLGYLAAVTRRVELVTGILILPQRQTVLVAKQAAEADVLTNGRLRLGVGVGRIALEYEALGENFHNRGRRVEEQIEVLRALWTNETVNFHGRWHHITDAGINPLPLQRPIPIWMGGGATDGVLKRIGRLADGWIPGGTSASETKSQIATIWEAATEAGRDPRRIALTPRVMAPQQGNPYQWRSFAQGWQQLGAEYVVLNTMRCGFTKPEQHLALAEQFKEALQGIAAMA